MVGVCGRWLLVIALISGAACCIHDVFCSARVRPGPAEIAGIDIGSMYSSLAVVRDGSPHVLARIPSTIGLVDGEYVVGVDRFSGAPGSVAFDLKHLLGVPWESSVVKEASRLAPFEIVRHTRNGSDGSEVAVRLRSGRHELVKSVSEAVQDVTLKLVEIAQSEATWKIDRVVLAVPFHSDVVSRQRRALVSAVESAGLHVVQCVTEPLAAAYAHGLDTANRDQERVYVVVDWGSSLRATVVVADEEVFEVIGHVASPYRGGDEVDLRLARHILDRARGVGGLEEDGVPLSISENSSRRLHAAMALIKPEILSSGAARVYLESFHDGRDLDIVLTLDDVSDCLSGFISSSLRGAILQALQGAGEECTSIDGFALAGGTSSFPAVRQELTEHFKFIDVDPRGSLPPAEVVASGLAMVGRVLGGVYSGEECQPSLWPLLSVGIESDCGEFHPILTPGGPMSGSLIVGTERDMQENVRIAVYEGSRRIASENELLTEMVIEGIALRPARAVHVEVRAQLLGQTLLEIEVFDSNGRGLARSDVRLSSLSLEELRSRQQEGNVHAAQDAEFVAMPCSMRSRATFFGNVQQMHSAIS